MLPSGRNFRRCNPVARTQGMYAVDQRLLPILGKFAWARLQDRVGGAHRKRLDTVPCTSFGQRGDDDDGEAGMHRQHPWERLHAAHSRHLEVEQDHIHGSAAEFVQGAFTAAGGRHHFDRRIL